MKITKISILFFFVLSVIIFGSCASIINKTLLGEQSSEQWSKTDLYKSEQVPVLTKKNNEDFRILLFSDIQLLAGPAVNQTLEMVDLLVKETKPDMIMTTGDNTAWIFAHKYTEKLIAQMESYGIPWGVTLGNHDDEGSADRIWHGNQYEKAEHSLFSSGPANLQGIGNYSVSIEDEEGNLVYTLIMIDSNVNREYPGGVDYDYIHYDQVKWYEWLTNGINSAENRVVPSMLFFHIPLPEFRDAYHALLNEQISDTAAIGENREDVFAAPVNTGLFDSILKLKSTTHIFCGHDHINNSSINWKGVRLSYGLKTGPTSYSDDDMHGATLITLKAVTNDVSIEHLFR